VVQETYQVATWNPITPKDPLFSLKLVLQQALEFVPSCDFLDSHNLQKILPLNWMYRIFDTPGFDQSLHCFSPLVVPHVRDSLVVITTRIRQQHIVAQGCPGARVAEPRVAGDGGRCGSGRHEVCRRLRFPLAFMLSF
jgi:hypothetical protein